MSPVAADTSTAPFASTDQLALNPSDTLDWASSQMRGYCGWHIFPSTQDTITLDGGGGQLLLLPSLYVTSVDTVTISDPDPDVDPYDLNAADFTWSTRGVLSRAACYYTWPAGMGTVDVTFTHGYDNPPGELVKVCVSAAKRMPAQVGNIARTEIGTARVFYAGNYLGGMAATGWTFDEQQILDRYRIEPSP